MLRITKKLIKNEKRLSEARNKGELAVYNIQKSLDEHRAKVPAADAELIEKELRNAKEAVENKNITDPEEIESKLKKLNEVAQKIGEAVNKGAQGGGGSSGSGSGPSGSGSGPSGSSGGSQEPKKDGDNVDADFEEVPKKETK